MSEYQYYEFQAIDRPLAESEMRALRAVSSRATITPTSFVNVYHWGDFKGKPSIWMEKYFDAFLYLANWGTHQLMFRLPRRLLDVEKVRRYCPGEPAAARASGDFVVLELCSESGDGDWETSGEGLLAALVPLRADITGGDYRALYLAWLLCMQDGQLEEDAAEPPCPPGLGTLTASLKAFASFLRIRQELIEAAASRSLPMEEAPAPAALKAWIAALPDAEKTALLVRWAIEDGARPRAELLRRFRTAKKESPTATKSLPPRTIEQIIEASENLAAEKRRRDTERAAREKARREREEAELSEKRLSDLASREPDAWRQVESLIATRRAAEYEQAVQLLADLMELGKRAGRAAYVAARLCRLRMKHARKVTLLDRLTKAGLGASKDAGDESPRCDPGASGPLS